MAFNLSAVLDSMISVAKAAAPLVGHGAPEAIALGERVIEMIDHAKEAAGGKLPAPLEEERDAMEARVNAHVDKTAAALRGDA